MHPGIPLLAETLREAGYDTAGFSANAYVSALTGLSRGFRWFETVFDPATGAHDAGRALTSLRAWLEVRRPDPAKEGPFFLFVNFMDTHLPLSPPRSDVEAVREPTVLEEDLRLASGWGRRPPKHAGHDWAKGLPPDAAETADEEAGREDPPEDLDIAGDAGAISGRATGRTPAPTDERDDTRGQ